VERPHRRVVLTWYLTVAACWFPLQLLFFWWLEGMLGRGGPVELVLAAVGHALVWPASAPVALWVSLVGWRYGRRGAHNNRVNGRVR
jgi:hypothetical protein